MANNRMYLKNKRTGEKILLAKYFPTGGWQTYHANLDQKLDDIFEQNEAEPTFSGDNDWEIEYEGKAENEIH